MLYTILTMGLPAIDQSLDGLLKYLQSNSPGDIKGMHSLAVAIAELLALCVMAYECWMMMLGRRVLDVMKLLRIIGLSLCIAASGTICSVLELPGKTLESTTKNMAEAKNKEVAVLERKVATLQNKYYEKVRALQDSIEAAKRIEEIGEDASWYNELIYTVKNLSTKIDNVAKKATILTETKITEWANLIIRFIGEAIFQITYYGLLIMQLVFMKILALFAPLMFALSIAPPWNSAWSQWMSKYLSLSLWGFVIYLCVFYADAILLYTLEKDITAYTALIGSTSIGSWESIGTLGMQGIGSTCMYFVGMCIGAVLLKSVPEVCSWLIPGGVSSSSAGSAGMGMMSSASAAGGAALGAASGVMAVTSGVGGAASGAMSSVASVAGAMNQASKEGQSTLSSIGTAIASHTSVGKGLANGSEKASRFGKATGGSSSLPSPKK